MSRVQLYSNIITRLSQRHSEIDILTCLCIVYILRTCIACSAVPMHMAPGSNITIFPWIIVAITISLLLHSSSAHLNI